MLKRVGQFVAAAAALAASTSAPSAAEARPLRIRPMWGDEGHQITALVAMQLLNAQANSTVAQVLGGQTLMEVSTWADSVKHTPGYQWSASYHFVDTPDWACTYQESYCQDACVVDAINNYTKRATTQTGQQQNEAVKFITHFVGDAHQPLHVAFASDRGGNDITGTYTGAGQSLSTNLHAVWDFCILEQRMNGDFGGSVEQYAAYLLKQISGPWASQAAQWATCQSGSFPCPDEWAAQTAQFGCNYGYTDQDGNHIASGFNLGDAYYAFTSGIVDQQLATGGVRLGALINSIYGSSSSAAEAKRD